MVKTAQIKAPRIFRRMARNDNMYRAIGIVVLLILWSLGSRAIDNSRLLPSPGTVLVVLAELVSNRGLVSHILASLKSVLLGFGAATLTAAPIGLAMGRSRRMTSIIDPLIELLRPIPPFAWIPFVLIGFGAGEPSRIAIVWIACFMPILINSAQGARHISPVLLNASRTLGAGRLQNIQHVIIPATLPQIFTGMRISFGLGWMSILAAEMIGATTGIGYVIREAREFLQTDVVLACVTVIGLLGLTFALTFKLVEGSLFKYEKKSAR